MHSNQHLQHMKKATLIIMLAGLIMMAACSSESSKVEHSIKTYVKKGAMDPDKVKYEIVYSALDTIPYYLKSEVLNKGAAYGKSRYDFFTSTLTKEQNLKELQEAYKKALANKTVAYICCVNVTEETPFGAIKQEKIIICDKENPDSILGAYNKDLSFVKEYRDTKEAIENYEFKTNEFAQVITDSLSPIEKYIMDGITIGK